MFTSGASTSQKAETATFDENVEAVKKSITENRLITIRKIAENVAISAGSYHIVLTDVLDMKSVAAKLLNFDREYYSMSIA